MEGLTFETLTALGPSNHLFIVVADAAWECCLHYFEALESQQLLHSVVIQAFQFAGSKHELARSQFGGGDIHLLSNFAVLPSVMVPVLPHGGGVQTACSLDETARMAQGCHVSLHVHEWHSSQSRSLVS